MTKQIKFGLAIGTIFGLAGIILLLAGLGQFISTRNFLQSALEAQGQVLSLRIPTYNVTSSGANRNSIVYYPVVEFPVANGQTVTFVSSVGSNPSPYQKGSKVTVLYNIQNPQNAKIKSFMDLWFGVLVCGGLGIVFLLFGLLLSLLMVKKIHLKKWLLQNGQVIETEVQSCYLNGTFAINGIHPYIITSQWQDPATQTVHEFKSEDIWYNPAQFVAGKKIKVYIESQKLQALLHGFISLA